MIYNCGACGGTIDIATKLYLMLSPSDLDDLCMHNDNHSMSDPFYDSVMSCGESVKVDRNVVVIQEPDEIEDEDTTLDVPDEMYEL